MWKLSGKSVTPHYLKSSMVSHLRQYVKNSIMLFNLSLMSKERQCLVLNLKKKSKCLQLDLIFTFAIWRIFKSLLIFLNRVVAACCKTVAWLKTGPLCHQKLWYLHLPDLGDRQQKKLENCLKILKTSWLTSRRAYTSISPRLDQTKTRFKPKT